MWKSKFKTVPFIGSILHLPRGCTLFEKGSASVVCSQVSPSLRIMPKHSRDLETIYGLTDG